MDLKQDTHKNNVNHRQWLYTPRHGAESKCSCTRCIVSGSFGNTTMDIKAKLHLTLLTLFKVSQKKLVEVKDEWKL